MKVIIALAFFIAFATAQEQKCPANMEFTNCGSACPPTCDNLEPQMCTMQCIVGCVCKAGLVKDSSGNCIDPKQCPGSSKQCTKPHQKYNECGTACPAKCDDKEPRFCTEQCVQGCFCEDGYVLNEKGDCVLPKDCPASSQQCKKAHEKFTDCGSSCAATCSNKDKDIACPAVCVQGCFCEPGYVRDDQGNCVEPSKCPGAPPKNTTCGKNERWSNESCVAPAFCQGPRCPNNEVTIMCKIACTGLGGCVCKDGFYRDDQHKCVRLNRCNNVKKGTTGRPLPRKPVSSNTSS